MGSPLVDGLFGVAALAGVLLCALAVYCYRRWDEPGVVPFAVFTIVLGIAGITGGVSAIVAEYVFTPRTQRPAQPDLVKASRCFGRLA